MLTAFWYSGPGETAHSSHEHVSFCNTMLTHTIDKKSQIWYIPPPPASMHQRKVFVSRDITEAACAQLYYCTGELQSWLILNTKLERYLLSSLLHKFFCESRT